jgi:hypothetical protein
MAKRETVKEFVNNLKNMPQTIIKLVLTKWNQVTLETTGVAKELAPQSNNQRLTNSMTPTIKAKLTKTGLKSALIARVPYAGVLEKGERKGKKLNYKSAGEISYYEQGKKIYKLKKGGAKFMERAVDRKEDDFMQAIMKVIDIAWVKI